jgi:hypothetical protein
MDAGALESFEGRAEFVEAHAQSEKATAKPSRFMRLRGAGEATRIHGTPRAGKKRENVWFERRPGYPAPHDPSRDVGLSRLRSGRGLRFPFRHVPKSNCGPERERDAYSQRVASRRFRTADARVGNRERAGAAGRTSRSAPQSEDGR